MILLKVRPNGQITDILRVVRAQTMDDKRNVNKRLFRHIMSVTSEYIEIHHNLVPEKAESQHIFSTPISGSIHIFLVGDTMCVFPSTYTC